MLPSWTRSNLFSQFRAVMPIKSLLPLGITSPPLSYSIIFSISTYYNNSLVLLCSLWYFHYIWRWFYKTKQLIFEGVAKSVDEAERAYRGYLALDDIQFQPMGDTAPPPCHGHCTFEGGMCGWTNQEEGDDFDWTLARGSDNFFTGPARDFYSFSKEYPMGGFIYIDAGYPRRPGDRAFLISPQFEPTESDQAICFRFATHMYGNGVGTLRVWLRPTEGEENAGRILWEMSGDAGNNWYTAQLPIASPAAFQIAFEGVVGSNYLGNIAIDAISLQPGSCPSMSHLLSSSSLCIPIGNLSSWQ